MEDDVFVESPSRFLNLRVEGFRRLAKVDIQLRPLNVLIGANGVGKTSLLDALSLLASSAQGSLNAALSELSGLPAILTYDRSADLGLGLSLDWPGHSPLDYSLCVRQQGNEHFIRRETLSQPKDDGSPGSLHIDAGPGYVEYHDVDQGKLVRPYWQYDLGETALSQVPRLYRTPEEFRRRLASSTFYHVLDVGPRSPVRLPQPMRPATLPGRNGEDLVSALFSMQQADRDRFEAVEDAIRSAFPGFQRLDFPPVAAGTLAMTWREDRFSKPLYMHQLSEGTLRFLWLATLLQSPGLTALTLLDEPEVSLHPELLNLLAGLLREAARRTQIVVATHSDRLIRFLKPDEVIVMDTEEDGSASLTWADSLDLEHWLEEYTLDELWRSGHIGARA
ncbi:MAG: AAA family ATPase [Bryobacteraceae bacterium]|nr:AAA family ATPase [Bryobacteraceae bacterium]